MTNEQAIEWERRRIEKELDEIAIRLRIAGLVQDLNPAEKGSLSGAKELLGQVKIIVRSI